MKANIDKDINLGMLAGKQFFRERKDSHEIQHSSDISDPQKSVTQLQKLKTHFNDRQIQTIGTMLQAYFPENFRYVLEYQQMADRLNGKT